MTELENKVPTEQEKAIAQMEEILELTKQGKITSIFMTLLTGDKTIININGDGVGIINSVRTAFRVVPNAFPIIKQAVLETDYENEFEQYKQAKTDAAEKQMTQAEVETKLDEISDKITEVEDAIADEKVEAEVKANDEPNAESKE